MSNEYEYVAGEARLTINPAASGDRVYISAQPTHVPLNGMWIPNASIPNIAAELLQAGGHHYLAGYIEADIDHRQLTEAEAAEKKLQERRTSVLAALLPEAAAANNLPEPHELSTLDDRAIDRIIELEDGQAK